MNQIVIVSAAERAHGALSATSAAAATGIIERDGFVVLRGAFAVEAIDAVYREFFARYGALGVDAMQALSDQPGPVIHVGDRRFEIVVPLTGAIDAGIFANPLVCGFLTPLLGPMQLSSFTAVASYPGSDMQRLHRDSAPLFPDCGLTAMLPVYAVSVSIPLIDVDLTVGPTGVWPGSHHSESDKPARSLLSIPFQRGDAVLIDYRTAHAGLANRSTVMRPIVYAVYARPWFVDDFNHQKRAPLDMPLEVFERLPEDIKPLLIRAYSHRMRAQVMNKAGAP